MRAWKSLPQVWHRWVRGVSTALSARAFRVWRFSLAVLERWYSEWRPRHIYGSCFAKLVCQMLLFPRLWRRCWNLWGSLCSACAVLRSFFHHDWVHHTRAATTNAVLDIAALYSTSCYTTTMGVARVAPRPWSQKYIQFYKRSCYVWGIMMTSSKRKQRFVPPKIF